MTNNPYLHQKTPLLGQRSPAEFMQQYWQKAPLLIQDAIQGMSCPVSAQELYELSAREDVQSRLIRRQGEDWQLEQGPFHHLPSMQTPNWTLLVQSVDLHNQAAAALSRLFRFIPDARFDDVMISLASPGGGVGPHFDTYDVFLLQASGQRRWQISNQEDKRCKEGLPCRILKDFQPQQSWVLNPGDMLYLPPDWAHDGVALTENCITVSIGFRTLSHAALLRGMLEAAIDQVSVQNGMGTGIYSEPSLGGFRVQGFYRDPQQLATATPAELPPSLIQSCLDQLKKIPFNEELAVRFLGCWLTEPNPLSVFESTQEPLELEDLAPDDWLVLNLKTRMLYRGEALFINGETIDLQSTLLKRLADDRRLSVREALSASEAEQNILLQCLDDGWIEVQAHG